MKKLKVTAFLLMLAILWMVSTAISSKFISHEIFEKIHPLGGFILILLVGFHISLNWKWIKASFWKN